MQRSSQMFFFLIFSGIMYHYAKCCETYVLGEEDGVESSLNSLECFSLNSNIDQFEPLKKLSLLAM